MNEREQLKQAYSLLSEGVKEVQSDRLKKGLNKFEEGLELSKKAGDRSLQLKALRNLADVSSKLGNQQRAIKFNQQALSVARKEKDSETERIIFNKIGLDYCQLGDYDGALRFQARALVPPLELNDDRIYNAVVKGALCDLGKTLELKGNKALARQCSNQADAPSFSILYVWKILENMARIYERTGDKERTKKFARLAKKAKNECQQCLIHLAKDLEKIGEKKRAKEFNLLAEQTDKTDLSLITVVNQVINKAIQDCEKGNKSDGIAELKSLLSQHQLRVYYRVPVVMRSAVGMGILLDDN